MPPSASFRRGAIPSPRAALLAAPAHTAVAAPPPQFAMAAKLLSMWGNQIDGDCVSAEQAYAKGGYSIFCGLPDLFIPESEVVRWAGKYGFLNGASIVDVMTRMQTDGFTVGGVNYKNGPFSGVNYADETTLRSALTVGPVSIAIDANALPPDAGMKMGWHSVGRTSHPNTDHCVSVCGYGPAKWLYQQINTPLPANLLPDWQGYLVFTWSTIGFVDHPWLLGTCVEAWVRNPTTLGQGPPPPPPPPPVFDTAVYAAGGIGWWFTSRGHKMAVTPFPGFSGNIRVAGNKNHVALTPGSGGNPHLVCHEVETGRQTCSLFVPGISGTFGITPHMVPGWPWVRITTEAPAGAIMVDIDPASGKVMWTADAAPGTRTGLGFDFRLAPGTAMSDNRPTNGQVTIDDVLAAERRMSESFTAKKTADAEALASYRDFVDVLTRFLPGIDTDPRVAAIYADVKDRTKALADAVTANAVPPTPQ